MATTRKTKGAIRWLAAPEAHDYPAALSYLTLQFDPAAAGRLVRRLRRARSSVFKAKDIFRASGLSLLGVSNRHVDRDLARIAAGEPLSPVLLVRSPSHDKLIIADGYHRLCAVYSKDEDALIPCRIV